MVEYVQGEKQTYVRSITLHNVYIELCVCLNMSKYIQPCVYLTICALNSVYILPSTLQDVYSTLCRLYCV